MQTWGCVCSPSKSRWYYVCICNYPPQENGVPRFCERFSDRWEVCISLTDGSAQQVGVEMRDAGAKA